MTGCVGSIGLAAPRRVVSRRVVSCRVVSCRAVPRLVGLWVLHFFGVVASPFV